MNGMFIRAMRRLDAGARSSLQVIHITGIKDYDWAVKEYDGSGVSARVYSCIDRIEEAYSASDLVGTRSGASAIFELAFFGRPMVLIPYPFAMSHQSENARVFAERGAAVKIEEKDLSADILIDTLSGLFNNRARLKNMAERAKDLSAPEASENLAEMVFELAGKD